MGAIGSIVFFPLPATASCCDTSSDVAPCDCGLGEEIAERVGDGLHPNEVLMQRFKAVQDAFGEMVILEMASYGSNAAVYAAIDKLNEALVASGRDFLVSPANFYTFLGTLAPLIIVKGQITFTRRVPEWDELRGRIQGELVPARATG